jgi:hypothetical protein
MSSLVGMGGGEGSWNPSPQHLFDPAAIRSRARRPMRSAAAQGADGPRITADDVVEMLGNGAMEILYMFIHSQFMHQTCYRVHYQLGDFRADHARGKASPGLKAERTPV